MVNSTYGSNKVTWVVACHPAGSADFPSFYRGAEAPDNWDVCGYVAASSLLSAQLAWRAMRARDLHPHATIVDTE